MSKDIYHGFQDISNSEVIWGAKITEQTTGAYSSYFSHSSSVNDGYGGWNHIKTINSNLYDKIPSTDKRKNWFADKEYNADDKTIGFSAWGMPYGLEKYTSLKFYSNNGPGSFLGDYIYLRNAEFYLTKAEAQAKQGKYSEAQETLYELNKVRDPSYTKSTKTGDDLIDEILLYRRIELWGDGVAAFDMARNGIGIDRKDGRLNPIIPGGDLVLPPLDDKLIFPIPQSELDGNPFIN